jgi:hypothetical protein
LFFVTRAEIAEPTRAIVRAGAGGSLGLDAWARNADGTFAKLLRGHARVRGGRPAFRHKVFGIWRTWSEVYEETRALAQGLVGLGFAKATDGDSRDESAALLLTMGS